MTEQQTMTTRWWTSRAAKRYLVAFGLDQAADAIVYVLLAWVAVHEASQLGAIWIVGAAAAAKLGSLLLIGGALGDRFGPAAVVRTTITLRVLLLAGLVAVLSVDTPVGVAAFAMVYGLIDGAHEPSIQAMSVEVIPNDAGQRGVQGALDLARRAGLLAAGPVAGALILWASTRAVALVALVGLVLARVAVPATSRPEGDAGPSRGLVRLVTGLFAESREGWRAALRMPPVRARLAIFVVANVTLTPPVVIGVPLLAAHHHWSAAEFGLVDAGYALGAIAGGIVVARWGDQLARAEEWAVASLVPTAIAVAALGWVGSWPLALLLAAVAGVSTGFGPPLLVGAMKESTPADLQTRMQAARVGAIVAAGPAGFAIFGVLLSVSDLAPTITALAVLLAVSSVTFLFARSKQLLLT
ncbi:MFS transporter [Luteipulveratus sp. YIM 133132]|uniref:MFS transporter n=1 Tax=Luteipulveratus flavus TaxID=3031728 RepID=UPI0023AFE877|nr:MFS transporter [Luteipulveratus sp. YIM 133132]MDE9364009.1 MFS transporter [Luteipulveratus sp. YIM 133132]